MSEQIKLLALFCVGYGLPIVSAALWIYQAFFPNSRFGRWYHNSLFSPEGADRVVRELKEKSEMKWR